MVYVIAFFVLVFFSIFCGWVVAVMIDEEEARELEEGEKSLKVEIFELRKEIQNLKKTDKILLEAIEGNLKSIEILTEIVEQWKNLL